ncbi:MAG: hypothetical protein HGA87_01410 [Desulfobulbaceae bacterium]|nr:hypothetical protein [Desulfobulbaceae bacterium]
MMTWYVVFASSQARVWFNLFTGLKHAHVFAFTGFGDKCMCVDPLISGLYVDVVDMDVKSQIDAQKAAGRQIVTVQCDVLMAPRRWFGVYTCVTVIKSLICCRAWWVITPKQLYRHLTMQ